MKKIIAAMLTIVVLCFSLSACGNSAGKYMNGHKWGETGNEFKSIEYKNERAEKIRKIAGYEVKEVSSSTNNSSQVYSIYYRFDTGEDDEYKIYNTFVKEFGREADYVYKGDMYWYNGSICYELNSRYGRIEIENDKYDN